MDLSQVTPKSRTIEILHPGSGEPIGLRVFIASMQSKKPLAVQKKIRDEILRLQQRGKTLKPSQIEENKQKLLHAAIEGWEWEKESSFGGEQLEYNFDNLKKVMTLDWFVAQVEEELGDNASFFD